MIRCTDFPWSRNHGRNRGIGIHKRNPWFYTEIPPMRKWCSKQTSFSSEEDAKPTYKLIDMWQRQDSKHPFGIYGPNLRLKTTALFAQLVGRVSRVPCCYPNPGTEGICHYHTVMTVNSSLIKSSLNIETLTSTTKQLCHCCLTL